MMRRVAVFVGQFFATMLILIAAAAILLLARHGLDYRFDPLFRSDMNLFTRVALVVTIILFLVILCYRATKSTLED